MTVNSINFGCSGDACTWSTNLKMVSGSQTWRGSPLNGHTFTPDLYIPRGTTKVVELIGDMRPNVVSDTMSGNMVGQELQWSLMPNNIILADGGSATGNALGNTLIVVGQDNGSQPTVILTVNGSAGPITVSPGGLLSLVWSSASLPGAYSCAVVFNPTGQGAYTIARGLSGSSTINAPSVNVATAYQYKVVCPVSDYGSSSISDTVQVNVSP